MKNKIRLLYKDVRNSLSESEHKIFSRNIMSALINSDIYKQAETILIFVSIGSEPDTMNIIEYSLNNNKKVAVPVCVENDMFFYEIHSLSELQAGKFGIPTVSCNNSSIVTDFSKSLCVVPAICFDIYGNRVGYGGGYYDRFLSENSVETAGLCFERCICSKLYVERFDKPIDYIISENKIIKSKKEVFTYE